MYFLIPSGVDNEHIINTEGRAGWFYLYGQLVWTVNLNSIIFSDIFLPLSKKKKIPHALTPLTCVFVCEAVWKDAMVIFPVLKGVGPAITCD